VLESWLDPSATGRLWSLGSWVRQTLLGIWFYAVFAGLSHTVQTRQRLHEKETLAARAEALASAARLEALRARLNPHFLFNALHTLSAVVKFRPALAESAIDALPDALRVVFVLREVEGYSHAEIGELLEITTNASEVRLHRAIRALRRTLGGDS